VIPAGQSAFAAKPVPSTKSPALFFKNRAKALRHGLANRRVAGKGGFAVVTGWAAIRETAIRNIWMAGLPKKQAVLPRD